MSIPRLFNLVKKAEEKTEREDIFKLYVAVYPYFTDETFKSFDEFEEEFKPKKEYQIMKSNDEIMNELLNRKE